MKATASQQMVNMAWMEKRKVKDHIIGICGCKRGNQMGRGRRRGWATAAVETCSRNLKIRTVSMESVTQPIFVMSRLPKI